MIAVAFGTINVVGGFLVTDRMLGMFKSKPELPKPPRTRPMRSRVVIAGLVRSEPSSCSRRASSTRCYIVAFSMMIYGMMGLTGPRTAVRGNQTAAVGMAIAVIATLLRPGVFHGSATVWLIVAGVVIGTAIGVPAAAT